MFFLLFDALSKYLLICRVLKIIKVRFKPMLVEDILQLLPELVMTLTLLGDQRYHRLLYCELRVHVKVTEQIRLYRMQPMLKLLVEPL